MRDPFIVQRGERYLAIDLIVDHGKGEHLLTIVEETLLAPAASLGGLGLTERESEVLAWVAQGKTNREIGLILALSARTVQKHLEHLFQKLGVETRTAATLRAWQAEGTRCSRGRRERRHSSQHSISTQRRIRPPCSVPNIIEATSVPSGCRQAM